MEKVSGIVRSAFFVSQQLSDRAFQDFEPRICARAFSFVKSNFFQKAQ